jgi:hypothetical protein
VSLVAVLVIHLALNWRWIVCRAKALFGRSGTSCDEGGEPALASVRPSADLKPT